MFAKQEGEWNVSRVRNLNKFPTKENQTLYERNGHLDFSSLIKGNDFLWFLTIKAD